MQDIDVIERISHESNVVIVTPYVVVALMAAVALVVCMSRRPVSSPIHGRRWGIAAFVCLSAVIAAGTEGVSNQRILEKRHEALIAGLCREAMDGMASGSLREPDPARRREVSVVCKSESPAPANATALVRMP